MCLGFSQPHELINSLIFSRAYKIFVHCGLEMFKGRAKIGDFQRKIIASNHLKMKIERNTYFESSNA